MTGRTLPVPVGDAEWCEQLARRVLLDIDADTSDATTG